MIRLKLFVNVLCNAFNNVNNTTTVHAVIKNSLKSKNDIIFVSSTGISHAIDNAFDNKFVVDAADDDDAGAGAGEGAGAGVEIFVTFIMIKLSILQSILSNMFVD